MYRTKKDVDKHVSDILNKLKNENERNNRGFTFAKMYVLVRDFDSAKRYLAGYLSIKERDAAAHKLLGQIHEQTGYSEKALQSYKRSLELEENQKDVILKICELYCQLPVDPERARYWADRAELLFPNHDTVFKLRECIVTADGEQNSQDLEDLIAAELAKRPLDARLRIKLIKLYLDTERVVEAYQHAILVESKRPYTDCLDWYYCLTDTLEAYFDENEQTVTSEFYIHALNAYDRLVYLCLDERGKRSKIASIINQVTSVADCAAALHSFDQSLYKACQLPESRDGWWGAFLNHMRGQLYFHLGTFLLKRSKKEHGQANLKEASWMASGLFLVAYSFKPFDIHSVWHLQATELKQREFMLMYKETCFRLSQTGHMIICLCKEDRSKWLQKIRQQICTSQGREKIFQRYSNIRDGATKTSNFLTDVTFLDFTPEFPDSKTLHEYDDNAYLLYPDSLHHVVWLALQYYSTKQKIQPDYRFKIFDGLQFTINNLNIATPESFCQLDVDAFLHATVQTTGLAIEDRNAAYGSHDASTCLPVSISIQLCSDQQANWWSAAYRLYKNLAKENLSEMRRVLQRGIEVIRMIGLHGIDATLAVHLAETFAERARELKEQNNNDIWRHLESRAAHYWKAAIVLLEKLSKDQICRMPKERLFNYNSRDPSVEDVKKLLEEGSFYLACQAMNSNKNEEALEMFDSLKTPYSSYYQALIYKKLASEDFDQPRELITSEMRSKHIILLTKSRDAFYVTLDRIQGNKKHPLNQVLSYEVEEIETKLARIDPDTAQRHAFDALSDECVSSQDSEDRDQESPRPLTTPSRKSQLIHSTPHISVRHDSPDQLLQSRHQEEHTRPSPERLDAQVRYLTFSQESMFKHMFGEQTKLFTEQTKMFSEMSGKIVEELKEIKIHLEEIGKQIATTNRLRSTVGAKKSERIKQPAESFENDEYEYENYYYDEDETDESNAPYEYQYNSAYKYPEPVQNEYPYGNVTGLHGTSTVTYAPPQTAGRGLQRPAFPNYYSNGLPQQPMLPGANPSHVLGPGHLAYFGAGSISTGLPFSEGQKLPEFNFNPALTMVQTTAPSKTNPETIGKQSVFNRLGPSSQGDINFSFNAIQTQTTTSTTPTTAATGTGVYLKPSKLIVCQENTSLTSAVTPIQPATSITTTTASKLSPTAPHAFQITMPPKTSTAVSPTFQNIISSPPIQSKIENKQSTPDSKNRTASGDEELAEESTGGDFQPVIPLPDEVEVRTGEEDETVLFESRAKLFRFVNKEWKERGIGMLKILLNEKTCRSRILMRRDQVWKICANHFILSDMKLASMKDNDTTWLWAANDFADEKMVMERFCVKFKTAEIAQNFKKEFEKAQEKSKTKSPVVKQVEPVQGFGDKFKPKAGSWACDVCLINNTLTAKSCIACGTPRKGLPTDKEEKIISPPKQTGFVWPSTPTTTSATANKLEAESDKSKLTPTSEASGFNLSSTATTKSWSFGIQNDLSTTTPEKSTGFVFGGKKSDELLGGGFVFGASAVPKTEELIQYGGFTFKTSPTIKTIAEKKEESKTGFAKATATKGKDSEVQNKTIKSPKSGVFAQFKFSISTSADDVVKSNTETIEVSSVKSPKTPPIEPEAQKDSATMTPLSGLLLKAESGMSFSALAIEKPDLTKFKADPNFKGFEKSGASVFKSANKSSEDIEAEADVQFEPIVPLPELVEVRTGEEDDDKLFGERARLYRYDALTSQWKERGVGEMKILKNRLMGTLRILMRRDQVHKLCANHRIESYMELNRLPMSDRAWTWAAKDFAEEVESDETLAVKFKTTDLAERFRQVFQQCVEEVKANKSAEKSPTITSRKEESSEKESAKPSEAPLSQLFKPKENSWECVTCLIRNDGKDDKCVACNTPMNRQSTNETDPSNVKIPLSEMFKPKENSWECATCLIRNTGQDSKCVACNATRLSAGADTKVTETSKFTFGSSATLEQSPAFKFGTPTKAPVFKFGDGGTEQESVDFKFGTPQNFTFTFSGVRPKSPTKTPKTPEAESAGEGDDSVGGDDEGDHIFFSPVIPLPDKVEVKTGEEDEEILYCQRAKLFRMVGKEWKERGLGDFKMLKHKATGKLRFLMRREQVHKVCLNHYFSPDLNFVIKDDKSWMWGATDYADNEPVKEVFTLRFKTEQVAKNFMDKVEEIKASLDPSSPSTKRVEALPTTPSSASLFSFKLDAATSSPSGSGFSFGSKFGVTTSPSSFIFGGSLAPSKKTFETAVTSDEISRTEDSDQLLDDEDDLEIVYVKESTKEKVELAAKLMLPYNFYLYENKPPCPGCRGCNDDDWSFESKPKESQTSDECEIVKESKAEPDRVKQALDLKLPPNYYLYEQNEPCSGCRGCTDEETKEEKSDDQSETEGAGNPDPASPETNESTTSNISFVSDPGLDFANLAKKAGETFTTQSTGKLGFKVGDIRVFSTPKGARGGDDSDADEESSSQQPDIHFEPLVPLPELVNVVTGEEDEDIIFSQRAKLYRFDKTEWKERGLGDLKILKHKKTNHYRIILRREQIYKIACNHYITPEMNLSPLACSETSWCWCAMDFADEKPQLEQFAIKLKNIDIANKFAKVFKECQEDLKTSKQHLSDSITDTSTCDNSHSSMSDNESLRNDASSQSEKLQDDSVVVKHEENEGDEEEEEDDDEDDDDDDGDSVMFEKRVSLASMDGLRGQFKKVGMGNLRMLYDDDFYGARIQVVTDDALLRCNHLISIQSTLKVDGKVCTWGAEDYSTELPMHRQFQASFSSSDAAKEFETMFLEGKECAKQSDIWERPYNPAGGDNVGDNSTATTSDNNEIKACSPELAAALADIIRGLNKSRQLEWDNYGTWETEDQWTNFKPQTISPIVQEQLERFVNIELEQKTVTEKCYKNCLIQIPSQELAVRVSTVFCYAMQQLYGTTSAGQIQNNPQPTIILEGNRNHPDRLVVIIPRPTDLTNTTIRVPVQNRHEEKLGDLYLTLSSEPRRDFTSSPRNTAGRSNSNIARGVQIFGQPIARDSPDESHEYASVYSMDSTVYNDAIDEEVTNKNVRIVRSSPVKSGRYNIQSATSFRTVPDSDRASPSSNEYFFDPVESRSERCLSWLDDMPQMNPKGYVSHSENVSPEKSLPKTDRGTNPINTNRESDHPSAIECPSCRRRRDFVSSDSKPFYSLVPDSEERLVSAGSKPSMVPCQASVRRCCCPRSLQAINTGRPCTPKTVNTQYMSLENGQSPNLRVCIHRKNLDQSNICRLPSCEHISVLDENEIRRAHSAEELHPSASCEIQLKGKRSQSEQTDVFIPLLTTGIMRESKERSQSKIKVNVQTSTTELVPGKQSIEAFADCNCSFFETSVTDPYIPASYDEIRACSVDPSPLLTPPNRYRPIHRPVSPLNLDRNMELKDICDCSSPTEDESDDPSDSEESAVVVLTGQDEHQCFVLHCKKCRRQLRILSERLSFRKSRERMNRTTSFSPIRMRQTNRQSGGGISPFGRNKQTNSCFVSSQNTTQPIFVQLVDEPESSFRPVKLQVIPKPTTDQSCGTSPLLMRISPEKPEPRNNFNSTVQCDGETFHDPYDVEPGVVCTILQPSIIDLPSQTGAEKAVQASTDEIVECPTCRSQVCASRIKKPVAKTPPCPVPPCPSSLVSVPDLAQSSPCPICQCYAKDLSCNEYEFLPHKPAIKKSVPPKNIKQSNADSCKKHAECQCSDICKPEMCSRGLSPIPCEDPCGKPKPSVSECCQLNTQVGTGGMWDLVNTNVPPKESKSPKKTCRESCKACKKKGKRDECKVKAPSTSSSEYVTVSEISEPCGPQDEFLRFLISLYHNLPATFNSENKMRAGDDSSSDSYRMVEKLPQHERRKLEKKKSKRKMNSKEKYSRCQFKCDCCLGCSRLFDDEDDSSDSSECSKCKEIDSEINCPNFLNRTLTPITCNHRRNRMTVLTPRMSASWGGLQTIFDSLASSSANEGNQGRQRPKYSYAGRDNGEEKVYCRCSNSEADTGYGSVFPMASSSVEKPLRTRASENLLKSNQLKRRHKCRYCLLESPTSFSSEN